MAKDNNEPTPKLPATAESLLRKLEQRWADFKLSPAQPEQFARSNGLKFSSAEQIVSDYNRWLANFPTLKQRIPRDEILHAELAELRKLIAEKTPAPPAAPPAPKKRNQPQGDRVLLAIPKLFSNGNIDGIPNAVVRQKVAKHLQPETKKGLKVPDRKTMNCAIRQYRNRTR
jgi:hypothetical protein